MKIDLISLARQQVFEEYIIKRQREFDQWMKDADIAWKENRVSLPYPSFSMYPSEEEVYNRIELLIKKQGDVNAKEKVDTTTLVGSVTEKTEVMPEVETKLPILLQKRKDIL